SRELADDLRRFLEDRPVHARRPTLAMRLKKWIRRHQAAVLTAGVSLVLFLIAAVTILAVSYTLVRQEKDQKGEALVQARLEKERAKRAVKDYLSGTEEDPQTKAANFR